MRVTTTKKDETKIAKIIARQHERVFERKMLKTERARLLAKVETSLKEDRLVYEILPNGEVLFFFIYKCSIMPEYKEEFLRISNCYCVKDASIRKKFYNRIKNISYEIKKTKKIKRMVVDIYPDDFLTKKYFIKKGFLTSIELVGRTQDGLRALKKVNVNVANLTIKKAEVRDLPKLVNLDLASHLADKTSRMRGIFMKLDGKKEMRRFYARMFKNKTCLVAKENKKIAGSICYFIDKKNQYGLVASIFVARDFQGMGISKILYQKLLKEFSKRKLNYYIGSSTTQRVLSLSEKMGRKEFFSSIIVDI